jgi:hypothetical protein
MAHAVRQEHAVNRRLIARKALRRQQKIAKAPSDSSLPATTKPATGRLFPDGGAPWRYFVSSRTNEQITSSLLCRFASNA